MHIDLQTTWFLLVGALLGGYAVLDGFDLGVGILHLWSRTDEQRRIFLNAIGPVWDGNEVWLVTGGGALFAAFPIVYAAVFSGFYVVFWQVYVALPLYIRGYVDPNSPIDALISIEGFSVIALTVVVAWVTNLGAGRFPRIGVPSLRRVASAPVAALCRRCLDCIDLKGNSLPRRAKPWPFESD